MSLILLVALAAVPHSPAEDALPPHAIARLGSMGFYTGLGQHPSATSPDGRHFAVVGSGVVFSTVTGREEYRLPACRGDCCTYSPDGRLIAVGGGQTIDPATSSITVIDAASGKE